MSKSIEKSEVVDMENNETMNGVQKEPEIAVVGRPKWSLKKKLLIGGGILAGLALGAIALVHKKAEETTNDETEDSDDDDEEVDSNDTGSEEIPENVTE